MPIGPARMPFLQHFDELRKRAFVVFVVLSIATLGLYFFTDRIFKFILAPVWGILGDGGMPVALGVLDPMTVRFGLSFWSAVVITSPLILWEIMAFMLPALRPNERKWVIPTFVSMVLLFAAGVTFCYIMILPASFEWLAGQSGDIMRFMPQAKDMLTVVEFFLLGFGIAFQTPVVVFYLVYFGVIPYATLRANWRIIYVVLVIVAAGITPDWSPVSMGALAGAMILLYEMSMLLCRLMLARRIKRQKQAELEEAEA